MLSPIRSLAGCTIDTPESSFQKRQGVLMRVLISTREGHSSAESFTHTWTNPTP
jgi:hypothetical protein